MRLCAHFFLLGRTIIYHSMVIWRQRFLPFKGWTHMTWLCVLFERSDSRGCSARVRRHEGIHSVQQIELALLSLFSLSVLGVVCGFSWWLWVFVVLFSLFAGWIVYFLCWLVECLLPPYDIAYYDICFETEAYAFQDDEDYLSHRIPVWGWVRCIFDKELIARARAIRAACLED